VGGTLQTRRATVAKLQGDESDVSLISNSQLLVMVCSRLFHIIIVL
jgi:hypothetical protein